MYDFVKPNERGYFKDLATEALIWNNKVVDNELVGFRTLSVEGRENLNYEITKLQRPQNGDVETAGSIASKIVKVKFLIETDNSRDFNKTWYALKLLVNGSKQRFTFADEQDTYRVGTVQSITNEQSGTYKTTGVIEIYQSDPFIYGLDKEAILKSSGTDPFVFTDTDVLYAVRPDKVGVVFNIAIGAPAIKFTNPVTGEVFTIQATIPVKAGDRFEVDMNTGLPYYNGKYSANALSISSDIGNFKLADGMLVLNDNSMLREVKYNYKPVRI
ncbi:tail protein [Weissella phage PWc]|nr:tail protein [Weissella phage PWc]